MCHRVKGVSTCGPYSSSPRRRSSCIGSSRLWVRRSAQTHLPGDREQLIQDLQHLFIVVTERHSTDCSSTGRHPSHCDSNHLDISCLKFWKNFERQGQEELSSTPTGPSIPGFKECSNFQLPTTSCLLLRIGESDRTTQTSSSLLSIERLWSVVFDCT